MIFSKRSGVPTKLEEACDAVVHGEVHEIDVALANGIRYLGVAGFGFDSEVTRFANEEVKWLRGPLIYLWSILNVLPRFRPHRLLYSVDGEQRDEEIMFTVVSNSGSYGGGIRIAPLSKLDDRLLDLCVVRRCTKWDLIRTLPLAYSGGHVRRPFVRMESGTDFQFDTDEPMAVYADGELVGKTPLRVTLASERLRLVLPR